MTGIATAMYHLNKPIIPEHELVWYKATAFLATHFASMSLFEAVEVASKAFTYNSNKLDLKVFHDLNFPQFICLPNKHVPAMLEEHVDYHKYLSMTYESLGALLMQSGVGTVPAAAAATTATATATTTDDDVLPTEEVELANETVDPTDQPAMV
jgi:hypothetical protein